MGNKGNAQTPGLEEAFGTVTTCPDGHRTSTATLGAGTTVTGTNAGDEVDAPRRRSSRRQKKKAVSVNR
jgi:hypothetical protein